MSYNPDAKNGHDDFDDAMVVEPRRFFGQVTTEAYKCVLVKGQGKVRYDPAQHNGQRTSIAVHIIVTPCDPTAKLIEREMLNWTPEFVQGVRPSLEKVTPQIKAIKGLTAKEINPLREINGLWVGGEFVPRPGNKQGETWTTLAFTNIYKNNEECENAWIAWAEKQISQEEPAATVESMTATEQPKPNGNGNLNDTNKTALVAAFPTLWKAAQGDTEKFKASIASVFAPDAPEVVAFIAAQVPF